MARRCLTLLAAGVMTACGSAAAEGPDRSVETPLLTSVSTALATTTPAAPPTTPTTRPAPTTTSTTTPTTSTTSTTTPTTSTTTTSTLPPPPTTSCDRVAHIGDSTSVYLWEPQYIGGAPGNTMGARYRSVGVEQVVQDSNGGRSITERIADWQTTAFEVASAIKDGGFEGCWVIMIGTNDAANVRAGAAMGVEERINRMLYVIGDDPVLWLDAVTQGVSSAYRNESMRAWNEVLYRIEGQHPNLSVLRWSERVRPEWFQTDGIHYTPEGRAWRAAITALGLAESFPG